jgi:zinc transporter ZupT
LPRACFEVLFVFLVAVTTYFQGWYLLWPLALAGLLPWGWPAWRMVAWTGGAMAAYALFIWVRAWWIPGGPEILRVAMPVIAGPVLALMLIEAVTLLRARHGQLDTDPPPDDTTARAASLPGARAGR